MYVGEPFIKMPWAVARHKYVREHPTRCYVLEQNYNEARCNLLCSRVKV